MKHFLNFLNCYIVQKPETTPDNTPAPLGAVQRIPKHFRVSKIRMHICMGCNSFWPKGSSAVHKDCGMPEMQHKDQRGSRHLPTLPTEAAAVAAVFLRPGQLHATALASNRLFGNSRLPSFFCSYQQQQGFKELLGSPPANCPFVKSRSFKKQLKLTIKFRVVQWLRGTGSGGSNRQCHKSSSFGSH